MRTSAYPTNAHPKLRDVSQKHLGFFFDSGPNFKLLSLTAGSVIPGGRPVGHRALFLLSGVMAFDGELFDALSYFMLPSSTDHAALEARSDAQLLVLAWDVPGTKLPFEVF
jgi:hypothetical protein